jgi:hypothetical protein
MKLESLYSAMEIPETCFLGKRIFKKLFHENADLTPGDKKALSKDVESITWQYTLKPSTIPVAIYQEDNREYLEIAVIECIVNERRNIDRIAKIVHRAIPYPLIVVFCHSAEDASRIAISVAHKRMSRAEKDSLVVENFLQTPWIEENKSTGVLEDFLNHIRFSKLQQINFMTFYSSLVSRILALNIAGLTGKFELKEEISTNERQDKLVKCQTIIREVAELRAAVKKESSFARQVEFNSKLKELEKQLGEELENL